MALVADSERSKTRASRMLARCVMGASAAALLLLGFGERDAQAYVVKKTSRGEFVHWDERTVDYTFDPSVATYVLGSVDAARASMVSWSGTVGAPQLVGHPASDVANAPTKPGFDQKNGVFFMPNGYAPAGRALAITVLTYDNTSGRILDADIIVNGAYKFAVLTEGGAQASDPASSTHPSNTDGISHQDVVQVPDTVYDLHHVVAHELGHSLGMNDEWERKDALMYRYSSPNVTTLRAPASDDIAGLAELYSTKLEAGGNGCGNATVAPKKPTLASSHLAMFAALGFVTFLLLRGRSDKRARLGLIFALAGGMYAFLPGVEKERAGVALASEGFSGHARARVTSTTTTMESGLLRTSFQLATTACRAVACPALGAGSTWGGVIGNIRQEVGGQFAPKEGDAVDVSFTKLPSSIAPLSGGPLSVRQAKPTVETVSVLTQAND